MCESSLRVMWRIPRWLVLIAVWMALSIDQVTATGREDGIWGIDFSVIQIRKNVVRFTYETFSPCGQPTQTPPEVHLQERGLFMDFAVLRMEEWPAEEVKSQDACDGTEACVLRRRYVVDWEMRDHGYWDAYCLVKVPDGAVSAAVHGLEGLSMTLALEGLVGQAMPMVEQMAHPPLFHQCDMDVKEDLLAWHGDLKVSDWRWGGIFGTEFVVPPLDPNSSNRPAPEELFDPSVSRPIFKEMKWGGSYEDMVGEIPGAGTKMLAPLMSLNPGGTVVCIAGSLKIDGQVAGRVMRLWLLSPT